MSDAGRKMDVEDVLSSIRRLVSEEARTTLDTDDSAKTNEKTHQNLLHDSNEEGPDKLVLTPSLRVPEAAPTGPGTADIEQRIADIESLVMSEAVAHPIEVSSDKIEVQDTEDEAPMAIEAAAFTNASEAEFPQEEFEPAPSVTAYDFAKPEPPMTANIPQAPSEPVDAQPLKVDFEVESVEIGLETEFLKTMADDIEALGAAPMHIDFEEPAESEQQSLDDFPSDSPFEADVVSEVESEIVEEITLKATAEMSRESIVEREPEVDTTEAVDTHTDALDLEDEPKAETAPLFDDAIDYTDADDTFMDEESLREMVSDMVRSELQGELGDRITRNVRKLVRREIHRALASRDFE